MIYSPGGIARRRRGHLPYFRPGPSQGIAHKRGHYIPGGSGDMAVTDQPCENLSPIESLLQYRFATPNPLKTPQSSTRCRIAPLRHSAIGAEWDSFRSFTRRQRRFWSPYSDLRFRSSVMPSVSHAGETAHRRQRYALESPPHFHSIRSVGGTLLAKRSRKSASPMRDSRLKRLMSMPRSKG